MQRGAPVKQYRACGSGSRDRHAHAVHAMPGVFDDRPRTLFLAVHRDLPAVADQVQSQLFSEGLETAVGRGHATRAEDAQVPGRG